MPEVIYWWAIISLLLVSNGFVLFWALKRRLPATKEAVAFYSAIKTFEREHMTILRIEKINPDHLYLRSPNESR